MVRVKNLSGTPNIDEGKVAVAEFFGLPEVEVSTYPSPSTYIINISENVDAQAQYKKIMPFGNTNIPNRYDFTENLLVMWNGTKIQPA